MMNAGDVGSQAVYPRASKVGRNPPEGNDDASGSPWTSSLPLNSVMARPSPVGLRKESCFSAVRPVSGWNQCVKWVAPFSRAHSFIAVATESATVGSSSVPLRIVDSSASYCTFGKREPI